MNGVIAFFVLKFIFAISDTVKFQIFVVIVIVPFVAGKLYLSNVSLSYIS
jgi:hypothetical protein